MMVGWVVGLDSVVGFARRRELFGGRCDRCCGGRRWKSAVVVLGKWDQSEGEVSPVRFGEDEMRFGGRVSETAVEIDGIEGALRGRRKDRAWELYERLVWEGLSVAHWNRLINLFGSYDSLKSVGKVFGDALKHVRPDVVTFNTLMKLEVRRGKLARAEEKFTEMVGEGLEPDVVSYNTIIGARAKLGNVKSAKLLLDEMLAAGIVPSAMSFTPLFRAYGRTKDVEELRRSYALMRQCRVSVDIVTLNIYIAALGKVGAVDEAGEVLREMQKEGTRPNVVTLSTLMHMNSKSGRLSTVKSLYRLMRELRIAPNKFTYNTIINVLGKIGDVQGAERAFQEMLEAEQQPDITTINTLMGVYATSGKLSRVLRCFRGIRRIGLEPNTVSFNTLIDAYRKMGKPEQALRAFEYMREAGVSSDTVTYNTLLKQATEDGDVVQAETWFRELSERKNVHADERSFNILLDAYVGAGDVEKAGDVLRRMAVENVRPSIFTYNTFLRVHVRSGVDVVKGYMEEMVKEGLIPNEYTFATLIDAYGAAGDVDGAERSFATMCMQLRPTAVSYSSLLKVYARTDSSVNRIRELFGDMERRRLTPTAPSLVTVIDYFGKKGDIGNAERVFRRLKKHGHVPSVVAYSALLGAFLQVNRLDRALTTFEEMRDSGIRPDTVIYQQLVGRFIREDKSNVIQWLIELAKEDAIDVGLLFPSSAQSRQLTDES